MPQACPVKYKKCSIRFYTGKVVEIHVLIFFFLSLSVVVCPVIVTSDHRVVLSQCSGVALLPHRLQEQNWIPAGPPAYRPLQFANAGG